MFKDELIQGFKNKKPLGKNLHLELCYDINTKLIPIIINKYIIDYFNENFFNKSFSSIKRGIKLYYDQYLLTQLEEIHELKYIPLKISTIFGKLYFNSHIPIFQLEYEDKYKDILSIFIDIIASKITNLLHIYYYLDFLKNNYMHTHFIFIVNKCKSLYMEEILVSLYYEMAYIQEYEDIFKKYNLPYINISKQSYNLPPKIITISENNFLRDISNFNETVLNFSVLVKHIEGILKRKDHDKLVMIDRHNGFKFNNVNYFFSNDDIKMCILSDTINITSYETGKNIYTVCYDNGKSKWK